MISTCMNPFQRHQSESYIFGEAISMGNLTVNTGSMSIAERCCGSYNETKSFEFTVRRARLDIMNILGTTENQVSEKKTRLLKLAQLMFNPSSPQTPNRIQKTSNIIILPFHKSYKLMLCLQKVEMWQQKLEKQFQLTGNMTVYKKRASQRGRV